jgi:hypothetical protein
MQGRYLSRMPTLVDGIQRGAVGVPRFENTWYKQKCRMSILTIRHPALQSMCSKD